MQQQPLITEKTLVDPAHKHTWDGTVEREVEYLKAVKAVTHRDPGDIPGCVMLKPDPTLLDELGIVAWDTSDEYSAAIHEYRRNGHKSASSYKDLMAKLGSIGKIKSGAVRPPVRTGHGEQDDTVQIAPPSVLARFAQALRTAQ